jgi:ubiquitin carboxyl-terminal hydrolase 8
MRGIDVVANNGDDVRYWGDVALGLTGLKNLGKWARLKGALMIVLVT